MMKLYLETVVWDSSEKQFKIFYFFKLSNGSKLSAVQSALKKMKQNDQNIHQTAQVNLIFL